MNAKMKYLVFVVLMVVCIFAMSGCAASAPIDPYANLNGLQQTADVKQAEAKTVLDAANKAQTEADMAGKQAITQAARTLEALQHLYLSATVTETPAALPTATLQPTATNTTPASAAQLATGTIAPAVTEASWKPVQVAKYVWDKQIVVDGKMWELPTGTWFAVTTKNGSYEAVKSIPAGDVNKAYGWCKPNQYDCPPHALLVSVEVPADKISCLQARMDISWRIMLDNKCGVPVQVKINIRYNDQTRSLGDLEQDYLALAGLTNPVLDAKSEVGLFVSVRDRGQSELIYNDVVTNYGYSCWNCLPDTQGPDDPKPYPLTDIVTFGKNGSGPSGSSLIPGVVFPLPRPEATVYSLSFSMKVVDNSVVWVGRYDVPLSASTPTVTP